MGGSANRQPVPTINPENLDYFKRAQGVNVMHSLVGATKKHEKLYSKGNKKFKGKIINN